MQRVSECDATVFLVAEIENSVCGFIRAVYDGSRALIHLLSIHPDHQKKGIGRILLAAMNKELKLRGATTVSVTVTDDSAVFWERQGFKQIPVFLMLRDL